MTSPAMRLWGWPIGLGLLTASGLASALVSEGWGDTWAWLALGVPVTTMAWLGLRRSTQLAANNRSATTNNDSRGYR